MTTEEIAAQVRKHDTEIQILSKSVSDVVPALKENTTTVTSLIKTITAYTTKHDGLEDRMKDNQAVQDEILKKLSEHGEDIAVMKPTVESMRGLVWKVSGGVLVGAGGLAAVMVSILSIFGK